MILARLLSAQPTTDMEHWKLKFQLHKDIWHTDAYGQNPAPFYRQPDLAIQQRPPYPWKPGQAVPGNNLDPSRNTFGLSVDTTSYPAQIGIYGNLPVNMPTAKNSPQVPLQATTANTGGSIAPGTYSIAISFNGVIGPVSRFVSTVVPSGTNTNTITVSNIVWPAAATSVGVFAGSDSLHMTSQGNTNWTGSSLDGYGNPTVITLTIIDTIHFGLPDINFSSLEVQQVPIIHGGVWGDVVSSVSAVHVSGHYTVTLSFPAASWTVDQWAGRTLSLYYRPGVTVQPFADYQVTSNDANTITVTSLSSAPYAVGDVVVMRAAAAHLSSNTIGDDNFVNSYGPSGLTLNAEVGNQVLIIAGTGAGQPPKTIASNTATVLTIQGSWDVPPDSTSVYIIIGQSFQPSYTNALKCDGTTSPTLWGTYQVASGLATKAAAQSLLIQVQTADANGNSFPMRYAPFREVYVPAQVAGSSSGPVQTLTVGADGSFTPDLSSGITFRALLTADAAIDLPNNAPSSSSIDWSIEFDQDSVGGHTANLDSGYHCAYVTASAGSPPSTRCVLTFTTDQSGKTYPSAAPSIDQPIPS